MQYSVIIASTGRAEILLQTVDAIIRQSVSPAEIIISTILESDWLGRGSGDCGIRHIFGKRGIPAQLNAALDLLDSNSDVVFIFDDDVVLAPDYCERAINWFVQDKDLWAFDGHVLKDGGVTAVQALAIVNEAMGQREQRLVPSSRIYGCNMCARRVALLRERFDEVLSGYAWLFELDWVRRVSKHGKVGHVLDCHLVHLMTNSARSAEAKIGYMQIFHPFYLWKKGVISFGELHGQFGWRHVVANSIKAMFGVAGRRERLRGNFKALAEITQGKRVPTPPQN